jgi:hypothetical protein
MRTAHSALWVPDQTQSRASALLQITMTEYKTAGFSHENPAVSSFPFEIAGAL